MTTSTKLLKNATHAYFTNNCESGKRCYPTMGLARQAAKDMKKRGMDKLTPYECNKCSRIHLAHPKRSK